MNRLTRTVALTLAVVCLPVAGCADDEPTVPPAEIPPEPPDPTPMGGPPTSPNPRIRFKGPQRMTLELSRILQLDPENICAELGEFDCFAVHNVALGGTDPFGVALYSPSETSTATTPIAVERVVLSGCIERAVQDFANPANAVIFQDLDVSDGGLDAESKAVSQAIDTLYTRSMQRHATDSEVTHLRSLYAGVAAESDNPAQDWAALSCFAVLTSLEALFY